MIKVFIEYYDNKYELEGDYIPHTGDYIAINDKEDDKDYYNELRVDCKEYIYTDNKLTEIILHCKNS